MSQICRELHQLLAVQPRHRFPFDDTQIPWDGVYILYEIGELGHGVDKIVRIGINTGRATLPSRLNEHFVVENKDRSIFRKNIGRAILIRDKNPFLEYWELDLTSRKARDRYQHLVDFEKQREVEHRVTEYIQDFFSFCTVPIHDPDRRNFIESRLISTVSLCSACYPSSSWLGRFSPKDKIRQSGLWQVNKLYKQPLSSEELRALEELLVH